MLKGTPILRELQGTKLNGWPEILTTVYKTKEPFSHSSKQSKSNPHPVSAAKSKRPQEVASEVLLILDFKMV